MRILKTLIQSIISWKCCWIYVEKIDKQIVQDLNVVICNVQIGEECDKVGGEIQVDNWNVIQNLYSVEERPHQLKRAR